MSNETLNDKYRKFTDLPTEFSNNNLIKPEQSDKSLFDLLSKSEIGVNQRFSGPFGSRQGY